jgi:hypothetical protein
MEQYHSETTTLRRDILSPAPIAFHKYQQKNHLMFLEGATDAQYAD